MTVFTMPEVEPENAEVSVSFRAYRKQNDEAGIYADIEIQSTDGENWITQRVELDPDAVAMFDWVFNLKETK